MLTAPGSMSMGEGAPRRGRGWRSPQAMAILGADMPPAHQGLIRLGPAEYQESRWPRAGNSSPNMALQNQAFQGLILPPETDADYRPVDQLSRGPSGAGLGTGGVQFEGEEPRERRSGIGDWFRKRTMATPEPPYDKEKEVVCGAMYNDERDQGVPYKNQLQYDLATSYHFSGDFFRDYGFFVANWHPLFGICCSHPLHPWKKYERILALIVSLALTMLVPAFYLSTTKAQWNDQGTRMAVFLWITLPAMLLEVALYWFAMGDSYCRGNIFCTPVVGLIVVIKSACFFVALCIAAFAFFVIYTGLGGELPSMHLMKPFFTSRLHSWILWFPVWFLMPCFGFWHYWTIERRAFTKQQMEATLVEMA